MSAKPEYFMMEFFWEHYLKHQIPTDSGLYQLSTLSGERI